MSTGFEPSAHGNLSNPLEHTPNPTIVSRPCAGTQSMKMLDDSPLDQRDLHLEDKPQHDRIAQQRLVGELCIPKTEPSDVFDQALPIDEEALTDLNLSRTLIPFATPYKLKDPVIILERCDKIWQTLTLIKNAQSADYSGDSDTEESRDEEEDEEEDRNPSPRLTYVQYEPVLQNNNANFKLSVKTTERLYNCVSCSNFYSKKRDLQAHVYRCHEMQMPTNGFKPNGVKNSEVQLTERSKNHHKITKSTKEPEQVQEAVSQTECALGQEKGSNGQYVVCSLCNSAIKDVKKHLSTYHKVVCPDMMVNQFCKPISPQGLKRIANKNQYRKRDRMRVSIEKADTPVNSIDDHQGSNATLKKRRTSEPSQTEPKKRHTGDNTNLLERPDVVRSQSSKTDPSLQKRQQSKSAKPVANHTTKNDVRKSKTNSTTKNISGEVGSELTNSRCDDRLSNGTEEEPETTCVCGRSFRNVYTFTIHKTRCNIQSYIEGSERPTNSDRGSSVGLHLTIKKHNNSYEIVGREAGDNDISQSTDTINASNGISTTHMVNDEVIVTHLAEYSRDHTFVKLEVVDEDITVDIEDDDMTNNSDVLKVNAITTEAAPETDTTGKENVQDENVHTENSRTKIVKRRGRRLHTFFVDESELKPLTNAIKHVCPCGAGYQSEESLKEHVQRDHALCFRKCGYCKMIFKNVTELNEHSCLVIKGEPFMNLVKIPCSYCNMILDTSAFDEHISSKHLVSSKTLFKCYECVCYFEDAHRRQRHMTKVHDRRPCNFCPKTFSSRIRPKHDAYHFGLGFPCHDCKLAYALTSTLKEHREIVHIKRSKSLS